MYGIGASFGFFPCIGSGQEWFSRRRGTAVGLTLCGAGIGGLVVSNVFQALVSNGMDFRWALRILGFICLFFLSVSTLLVKRAPMSDEKREKLRAEATMKVMLQKYCHILKNPQYIMIIAMGFIASFAYSVSKLISDSIK